MTDRDLTPEEARAEVEAFLGPGWVVDAHATDGPCLAGVRAWLHSDVDSDALVGLHSDATTLRAAVSALKAAWRDAVRPWVREAFEEGELHGINEMNHKNDIGASQERAAKRLSRVLKEDS